jgi:hypothetical protein
MLFVGKCYWPGVTVGEFERAAATQLCLTPNGADGCAAYLGSLVFSSDELVLCVFEASSAAEVRAAAERVHLPCERVMPLTWLPATTPASRSHRPIWRRADAQRWP